jgi:hypothetical protein
MSSFGYFGDQSVYIIVEWVKVNGHKNKQNIYSLASLSFCIFKNFFYIFILEFI